MSVRDDYSFLTTYMEYGEEDEKEVDWDSVPSSHLYLEDVDWEDYNYEDFPHISLLVTEVENIGDSIWKQTSRVVGDSENTEHWPMLDRLFGSRYNWRQNIIESFRDYLIATEPEIYLSVDEDFGDENFEDDYIYIEEGGVDGYAPLN